MPYSAPTENIDIISKTDCVRREGNRNIGDPLFHKATGNAVNDRSRNRPVIKFGVSEETESK